MSGFVHLHVHSEYSLLDGACRLPSLVSRVKELGMDSVAVTDHGNIFAAVEFYKLCKKEGIKPIIGCEMYVAPRTRFDKQGKVDSPYHLILLCKNEQGYKNLCKLTSYSYTEGFYRKPRIDFELLERYHEGLVCLSGCIAGEVPRLLASGNYKGATETVLKYRRLFGDDYYIEVQNHMFSDEENILPYLYKLSNETGVELAATNDAHYINKSDAYAQKVLMRIATNTPLDDPNGMSFPNDEFYIKSEAEMRELFASRQEAVNNTVVIAEKCNLEFEFGVTKFPAFTVDGVSDNEEYLRKLAYDGLERRYGGNVTAELKDRIEYELGIISSMGFVNYFLIVWDFVHYAKSNGIPVGPGRGSGAGSLVSYCIGITEIDPIKYNLLFERFLNPERVSMPDFDIDFCIEGRQDVIDYVKRRYGEDHVAQIVTFGTLAARNAVRDCTRVMSLPFGVGDSVAKLIRFGETLSDALNNSEELKELCDSSKQVKELIDTAMQIEGMPRHCSTHAAGVVITDGPVSDYVPLMTNDGQYVTQYTMTVLDLLGILKIDFLGLRNLTVIRDAVREIRKREPNFDISSIPMDDTEVYKMLADGDTVGVFQFESAGMTSTIMKLIPEDIEDLIAVISLYRPGPMESIPTYIRNRHNKSLITYKTPLLKPILDVTYGCIVYQEQVMQIFRSLAGYSYGRADIVRRAMAKKKHDVLENERKAFIYGDINADGSVNCVGCLANGVSESVANEIFDEMLSFASYAFNKSHAAAYATVAYETAYLKRHYFKEYMAALLTSVLDSISKVAEYTSECESKGVKILPPDVNSSFDGFVPVEDGIRFGLLAVKSLGKGAINVILTERERGGKFKSLFDFIKRTKSPEISVRAIESLIMCGAFDCFPTNRRQMLSNYDMILGAVSSETRVSIDGQTDLFGFSGETPEEMELPYMPEYSLSELLEMEKAIAGIYISGHPLSGYTYWIKAAGLTDVKSIFDGFSEIPNTLKANDSVSLMSVFRSKKIYKTKSGELMAFCTVEDFTDEIEVIMFPDIYRSAKNLLERGGLLVISGHISIKDDEPPEILADDVKSAEDFVSELKGRTLCLKLLSTDKDKIQKLRELCRENIGRSRIIGYLSDLKKTTDIKGASSIELTNQILSELMDIFGSDNVKFFAKKGQAKTL